MDILNDDCLLYIFDFMNPTDWVAASEVCTSWRQLLQRKWKMLTEISIEFDLDGKPYHMVIDEATHTQREKLYSMIQYAGPFIRSIKLRKCSYLNGIIKFGKFFYYIMDYSTLEEVAKKLSRACKNISNVELKNTMLSLEGLVRSNQNIKKLSLNNEILEHVFQGINDWDTIDEVCVQCKLNRLMGFGWQFPKVKKLMFSIVAYSFSMADLIIGRILSRSRELKSLTLVVIIRVYNEQRYDFKGLTNVADDVGLPLLEELRVVARNMSEELMSFEDGTVTKMVSVCQNLRIIRLDQVELGDASADAFLALPKLEELYLDPVKKFSCLFLLPLNHLTRLTLKFDRTASLDFPSLCNALKKMPALLNLEVLGLSEKQSLELTCKAVTKGVEEDRDVIIDTRSNECSSKCSFLKICKSDPSKPINYSMPEIKILNLLIGEQSKVYCEDIIKFVDSSLVKCYISKLGLLSSESNQKPESEQEDDCFISSVLTTELDSSSENDSIYSVSHEMDSDEYEIYDPQDDNDWEGDHEYYEDQWIDEYYFEEEFW